MTLTFREYEQQAKKTRQFNHPDAITYCVLGLAGESGEVADKRKKQLRGDEHAPSNEDIKKEVGDLLWYVAMLADALGTNLEEVARANLDKIQSRQQRGVIKSSGDER